MAASDLMRLLHWLANPSNRAMSTHTEGKRTSQTDIIYTVERREGGGGAITQKLCSKAEWPLLTKHKGSTPMWTTEDR